MTFLKTIVISALMTITVVYAPPPGYEPKGSSAIDDTISRSHHTITYDPFELVQNDPSDGLVFGFITDSYSTSQPNAIITIDFYDTFSNVYRCHHRGIFPGTVYSCTEGTDNVFRISGSDPAVYRNPLPNIERGEMYIRVSEFEGMRTSFIFLSTVHNVEDESKTLMYPMLKDWNNKESMRFQFMRNGYHWETVCYDCKYSFIPNSGENIKFTANGIDDDIGLTKYPLIAAVEPSPKEPEITYNAVADECVWKTEKLEQSINDIAPDDSGPSAKGIAGGVYDGMNAVGNAMTVASHLGSTLKSIGKIAGALGPIGNIFKAGNAIFDFVGLFLDTGPTPEELTATAMREMTQSMDNMMDCTKKYTDFKINALKDYTDQKIQRLEESIVALKQEITQDLVKIQEETDAKLLELEYKGHTENVEQEIAIIEDVLAAIKRQLAPLNEAANTNDKIKELDNILKNTMPRFASAFKVKPSSTEFDYFWRLYTKETSIYIMEVITMGLDIWSMWIYHNTKLGSTLETVSSITPDYSRAFRDLNAELITEYIQLAPMAIYTIIDDQHKENGIQRFSIKDRFAEVELRLKPYTICSWIQMTQSLTDTSTATFLGTFATLYNEDFDKCSENIRNYIIDEVIRLDKERSDGGSIYISADDDSYYHKEFIVQSANVKVEQIKTDWNVFQSKNNGNDGINYMILQMSPTTKGWMISEVEVKTWSSNDLFAYTDAKRAHAWCSQGYVASGIRFVYWNDFDVAGFKLLCRPVPKSGSRDALYKSFTDYEIVSAVTDDANGKTLKYLEWQSCPIGKVIKDFEFKYDYDSVHMYLNSKVRIRCGSINNFKYYKSGYAVFLDDYIKPYNWQIIGVLFVIIFVALMSYIGCIQSKITNQYKKVKYVEVDVGDDSQDDYA